MGLNAIGYWSKAIAAAETPMPSRYSARDGAKLRLVPKNERLESTEQYLADAFQLDPACLKEACSVLGHLAPGKAPSRAQLAWARSVAYLQAGNAKQALKVKLGAPEL